jgi:hypothetical protein
VEAPVMEVTGDGKGTNGGGWRKMRRVWVPSGCGAPIDRRRCGVKIVWHVDGTVPKKVMAA